MERKQNLPIKDNMSSQRPINGTICKDIDGRFENNLSDLAK